MPGQKIDFHRVDIRKERALLTTQLADLEKGTPAFGRIRIIAGMFFVRSLDVVRNRENPPPKTVVLIDTYGDICIYRFMCFVVLSERVICHEK